MPVLHDQQMQQILRVFFFLKKKKGNCETPFFRVLQILFENVYFVSVNIFSGLMKKTPSRSGSGEVSMQDRRDGGGHAQTKITGVRLERHSGPLGLPLLQDLHQVEKTLNDAAGCHLEGGTEVPERLWCSGSVKP